MLDFGLYPGFMNALDALRQHTAKEHAAKRLRDHLSEERQALVIAAFAEGHTGPAIASAAGCSKERAYQLRDGDKRRKRRIELPVEQQQ